MKIKTMFTLLLLSTFFNPVFASSIENMERTRASLIKVILDPNLNFEKKETQLTDLKLKLLDKERIVINDKKIIQNPNRHTIRAFEEYELSFLVHASIEKNINVPSHWFNELDITTSSLDNTSLITK
ncbi:hypothetical protein OBA40_08150 [Alphaproteobacteria bacterium]|nr:hypothetical protein [Alphaproteobacteria bacterium]